MNETGRSGVDWDMDADSWDHRSESIPELEVEIPDHPPEVGRIYGPGERLLKIVCAPDQRPPFGFHPGGDRPDTPTPNKENDHG